MKFGVALESFTPPGNKPKISSIFQMSELSERAGFESLWVWDHILLGSRRVYPVLESLSTLSAIAARTAHIKLGTSILVLPLRNPVVVAKVLSTLHYLSSGRLIVGAAAGWYEREFRAVGSPFEKRGRVFEENFKLLRSLLSEGDVSEKLGEISLDHASIEPRWESPPQMLIGGYADRALKRAGRLGDGWASYYYDAEDFGESWKKVKDAARGRSQDLEAMDIVPLAIASSREEGMERAKRFTSEYMDLPKGTKCNVKSAIAGTVSDCVKRIEEYKNQGVTRLVFIPADYDLKQVEAAGKELIPSF